MVSLYRDPKGDKIFDKTTHGTSSHNLEASLSGKKTSSQANIPDPSKFQELEAKIAELESQLQQEKAGHKVSHVTYLAIVSYKL